MRRLIAISLMLLVASCTTTLQHQQNKLMDEIEARVELPNAALPLSRYARLYAIDDNKQIRAVYIVPFQENGPGETCSELSENFETQSMPCPSISKPEWTQVKAGQRLWLGNEGMLPAVADGGCNVVDVLFDASTRTFVHALCNSER